MSAKAPPAADSGGANASRSRSQGSQEEPSLQPVDDLGLDETRLRDLSVQWANGSVFYTAPNKNFPKPFRFTQVVVDASTGDVQRPAEVQDLSKLGWLYFFRSMVFTCKGKFLEMNALKVKEDVATQSFFQEVVNGLDFLSQGTSNEFYKLRPSAGFIVSDAVINTFLRYVIGYNSVDLQKDHQKNGMFPYGIGVRIGKKALVGVEKRFDAFLELQIQLLLAAHDLAPPIVGSFILQNEMEPHKQGHPDLPPIAKDGEFNVVTLMAAGQCALGDLFKHVNKLGFDACKNSEDWLIKVGDAILNTLTAISNLGFVLLDAKPGNFVYLGMHRTMDPRYGPGESLRNCTPKVWAVDFDVHHTGRVNPKSDNFHCVEMVNILMFLNTIQCIYVVDIGGSTSYYAPIAQIMMLPLRKRIHSIQQEFTYKNAPDTASESSDAFCRILNETLLNENRLSPLTSDLGTPSYILLRFIATRFKGNNRYYAGLEPPAGEDPDDLGCFPYDDGQSLFKQMIEYLGDFHWPADSNQEAREAWQAWKGGGTLLQPARQHVSVVDQVFAARRCAANGS